MTAITALALSSCAGDSGSSASPAQDSTLTIALPSAPTSLDPSRGSGGSNAVFQLPAYSALLHQGDVGEMPMPGLAESYEWIGDGNRTLQITLREGLMFSDGTPLDSEAVKASVEHFAEAGSVFSYVALPIASIDTPDERTVVFNLSTPSPTFIFDIAEGSGMGSIISPAALASDTSMLGTQTVGAGPYTLSPESTVEGSEYHYVPNEHYPHPDEIAWNEIVIKVIADPSTALAALQSGQVDITTGFADSYEMATGDGVNAAVFNTNTAGLMIQDREGAIVPALGDERVRQAINLAIDREAISKAVTFGTGQPTVQLPIPGTIGYDGSLDEVYSYDPERSRELLAEAGYGAGFDMPIVVPGFIPTSSAIAQALAAQFGAVGITLSITSSMTFPEFAQAQESGSFAGTMAGVEMAIGMPRALGGALAPYGLVNPRNEVFPDVLAAAEVASELSGEAADEAWAKVNRMVVEQALLAPVTTESTIYYYSDGVTGILDNRTLNPVYITSAL
ncbi:MAG: ABC transporter substrate-binding protein [Leucobacter sp.]